MVIFRASLHLDIMGELTDTDTTLYDSNVKLVWNSYSVYITAYARPLRALFESFNNMALSESIVGLVQAKVFFSFKVININHPFLSIYDIMYVIYTSS